jgi:hypothetical protein
MSESDKNVRIDDTESNITDYNDFTKWSKLDHDTITRGIGQVQYSLFSTASESHNLLVYPDIQVLRVMYPSYVKSLLDDNEIVLILTHYDHPSMVRQILEMGSKKNSPTDIEKYLHEGSLVIVDSLMTFSDLEQNSQMSTNISEDNNGNNNKTNFLSLIRMLLNHGVKNNKKGITILSDMGSFFHYSNRRKYKNNNDAYDIIHNIMEFEKSIPSKYRDLEIKKFCLYHEKDYELHFASKHQKAQLLDCHSRSILIMDGSNNNKNNINNNNNINNGRNDWVS